MRVCQPGPVAFQRAITSAGNRRDINLRGFIDTGLPPFLILARFNICSVSSKLIRIGYCIYNNHVTQGWPSARLAKESNSGLEGVHGG